MSTRIDVPGANWRTSSWSNDQNCVEVADLPGVVLVRDSKNRAAGHLTVSAGTWVEFTDAIKAGDFNR
jgi:hypothetical protein